VSFPRVGIVGLGLIGGSLAKLIREIFPDTHIVAVSRNQSACAQAIAEGVLSSVDTDLSALAEMDLVFVATPIEMIVDTVQTLQTILAPSAIVTDVASVKRDIVATLSLGEANGVQGAEPLENLSHSSSAEPRKNEINNFKGFHPLNPIRNKALFIGGHPMAGKETTGYAASDAKMFLGATYVLMPCADPRYPIFETYLKNLKFRVVTMSPEDHDQAVGLSSHGPYLMACLTAGALLNSPYAEAGKKLISSGFRDTTRVACSPSEWGTSVCLDNSDAVLAFLETVSGDIDTLATLIKSKDAVALKTYFETIAVQRRGLFPV